MSGTNDPPDAATEARIVALETASAATVTMQQEIIDYLHWLGMSSNAPGTVSYILGVPTVWHP